MTSASPSSDLRRVYEPIKDAIDTRVNGLARQFLRDLGVNIPTELRDAFLTATLGGKRFRAFIAVSGAAIAYEAEKADAPSAHFDAQPNEEAGRGEARSTADPCAEGDEDVLNQVVAALNKAAANPTVMDVAVALEFYQGAALVHDDIIDRSDTRRGRPTTHVAMAAHHASNQLIGDDASFGHDAAILTGDLLLAAADYALARATANLPPAGGSALLNQYSLMAGEVAVGQYLDTSITYAPLMSSTSGSAGTAQTLEKTFAVVRSKSARYSVVNPALLGWIAACPTIPPHVSLEAIFEPAGVAFQLRDDVLGVTGVEEATGKPTGIDVSEGKRTVLLALALSEANPSQSAELEAIYSKDNLEEDDIARAVSLITELGVKRHERVIEDLIEEARVQLNSSTLPAPAKCLAHHLTGLLVDRTA